jgi:phosphoribosyl 1,2-cyclic phosphodiesterase
MLATIWGVRGSIAVPSDPAMSYGGNTSCISVRSSTGEVVVVDAGTGARRLGEELLREGQRVIHLFISHLHLDHLEGLGFFAPIWSPDVELHIWGPPSDAPLHERLARYFSPPLFPVHIDDVPATLHFHDAPLTPVVVGGMSVSGGTIQHPGPTVGYRFEEQGHVLAYLTDHEPALDATMWTTSSGRLSGLPIAADADVLIHDCQYGDVECRVKSGWGHSSPEVVATFAERADVRRLILFHHDPARTDAELESMRREVLRRWGVADERCVVAKEGMQIHLDREPRANCLATTGARGAV